MNYHRKTDKSGVASYSCIMQAISDLFKGSLYSRSRNINDQTYSSFIVIAYNVQSKIEVIKYFDAHGLRSSKHLDFLA